jgi:hypothetical protein
MTRFETTTRPARTACTAIVVLAASLLASTAVAAPNPAQQPAVSQGYVYTRENLVRELCATVSSQSGESAPFHSSIRFLYQTIILRESGVISTDTREEIASKVRVWFNANAHRLLCSSFNFLPRNGNILKLAISSQSDSFIDDALRRWRVDLNNVDAVDGGTVLDYIDQMRVDAGSNADIIRMYTRYYDRFRAAGALHARELANR